MNPGEDALMSTSPANRECEILDAVAVSICGWNPGSTITSWNAGSERLYGWSRDEAIGRNVIELLKCDYIEPLSELESQLFDAGAWNGQSSRHAKDGSLLVVDINWALRCDPAGNPVEIIETARRADNILTANESSVELMRAYQALAESEKKYRDLFNFMPIALWQLDSREMRERFDTLPAAAGVEDLQAYLAEHPEVVDEAQATLRVTEVNERTLHLFGGTDRRELMEAMPGLWLPRAEDWGVATRARQSGASFYSGESTIRRMDGSIADVLFSVAFANPDDPQSLNTVGAIDITEEKRAKELLEQSERKYRTLFQCMPIALWQMNPRVVRDMFAGLRAQGVADFNVYMERHPQLIDEARAKLRITEANESTLHLFGAADRRELLEAMPALILLYVEDWTAAADARQSGAQHYTRKSAIRRMDGSIRDVLFSVAFANPDDPESLDTVGAIDITEEKQAKEALEQSERKYRTLVQYMPIAMVQIEVRELLADFAKLRSEGVDDLEAYIEANPEFLQHAMRIIRVEEANELCCRLFGARDSAELSGPVDRFFKVRPETLTRSLAARYSGSERFMEETQLSTLDGRVLDLLYTSAFSQELSEFGVGLVGMIDIGDRLDTERKLQQTQAEFAHAARLTTLGEFTGSIAHEVNQPLTAISINGQASLRWLEHDPPNVDEVRTLAGRIVADAQRAADIISRIRSMAARKDPRREPVDLGEVVRETVQFLHRELQTQRIRLNLNFAESLSPVLGDRTQLQQVVLNLIVNAMHAVRDQAPDRRQLTVRVARDCNCARVEVEDLGAGISEDDRPQLFSAFFTTKADGLGLGLSICRSIIDSHGGEIGCEHLVTGTRFLFSVPVAEHQPDGDLAPQPPAA